MKFVKDADREDWQEITKYPSGQNIMLRLLVEWIDQLSRESGHGEIEITSYIRLGSKKSYHYYGQAVDIRVKDKPVVWYAAMARLGETLGLLNPKWRINPHYEEYHGGQPHIHLEVRS